MSNKWLERIKDVWPWSSSSGQELTVDTEAGAPERLDTRRVVAPPVDVFENDQELVLLADVPGADADNTRIYWDDRRGLQLHVRRDAVESATSRTGPSDWYRAFRLPSYLDPRAARSSVRNGVLRVAIPRRGDARTVRIPVRAAG